MTSKATIYQSKCYLCNHEEFDKVEGVVRDHPKLDILKCRNCGLVFLSSFSHIDSYYYEESNMLNDENLDITTWKRENYLQNKERSEKLTSLLTNKIVLDFGCGDGAFLNNIKPFAKAVAGVEMAGSLRKHITENYKIQVFKDINDLKGTYDVITMFHVIEHLHNPLEVLNELKKHLNPKGIIYIETPNSNDALLSLYDCKAFKNFTYWGCHLYLFSPTTLETLIGKTGLKINYVSQIQRYPLANHLYWLAKGKPGGHTIWSCYNTTILAETYEAVLAKHGLCDTLIASISQE